MSIKTLIMALSLWLFLTSKAHSQVSWEIDKDKDGVKIYTKLEKDSDFKSFKAVVLLNASSTEIIKILKNADRYSEWYGYTKTSKRLKQEKNSQYIYVETIFPWPYKNRDMVYSMSIKTLNSGDIELALKGLPMFIPKKQGIVRMKKAEGYIRLKTIGDKTEVTYQLHSEPGSNVPPWLANSSIAEMPYKTLTGLRKVLLEKSKCSTKK